MKQYLNILLFVALSVATVNCNTGQTPKAEGQEGISELLDPIAFQKGMAAQLVVDVRTPREFNAGHIDGALNLDISNRDFKAKIAELDKNKPVYLYCRSGKRSARAARMLSTMGFLEVYDLKGGIINWQQNQLNLVK
jgi:rhodanese-related sulfurtransferase